MGYEDEEIFGEFGSILPALLSGSSEAQEEFEEMVPRLNAAGAWMRQQDPSELVDAFKEAASAGEEGKN